MIPYGCIVNIWNYSNYMDGRHNQRLFVINETQPEYLSRNDAGWERTRPRVQWLAPRQPQ